MTGPSSRPDSSTQVVPVISPLPFSENHPPKTGAPDCFPRGQTAVTPVRTACFPSPEMSVVWPTSSPATSVIAFKGPGAPSNGTPSWRARAVSNATAAISVRIVRIHAGMSPQYNAPVATHPDRKSTRLNSSHLVISYAVFCFKKKNINMVRAGEASGSLGVIVELLAYFQLSLDDLRNYIISSMIYPAFFFNDRATTEIYPFSLHDALPI